MDKDQASKATDPKKKSGTEEKGDSDPQEHMEGPVSSLVQGVKEEVEDNNNETIEDAKKREENK